MINNIHINKEIPQCRNTSFSNWIAKTYRFLLAASFLSLFTFSEKAYNDMGMIHATDAIVSEESQRAIIFHNGYEEVLILGTDLKASKNTGVIRFIPFPSEPSVQLAPVNSFETVNTLISDHGLKFISYSKGSPASQEAVELHFNEKLGAHDIAVLKVNDASGFRNWVNDFFTIKGLPQKKEYPDIEGIVDDYLKRGFAWFVFDFVELTEKTKFIEPVQYRFKTKALYYPLKTSNTIGGIGDISLILITPGTSGNPFEPIPNCLGIQGMQASTSSQIAPAELKKILPAADSFFENKKIFMQLLEYRGKYEFDKDIFADLSKAVPNALWDWGQMDGSRENLHLNFDDKPYYTYKKYTPPGNYFSLQVPAEWQRSEYDLMKDFDQFELIIHAPGTENMDYLIVSAAYYADEHKTSERFLYNLVNPESKMPGEEYASLKNIMVGGKQARVLDMKTYRYPLPGLGGKRIEVLRRYVIIPTDEGFFVLLFDSPSGKAGKFIPVFNDILNSFTISVKKHTDLQKLKEITADDYKVYTDFFATEKLPNITLPEYFENVLKENKISGKTSTHSMTDQNIMRKLKQFPDTGVETAFASYKQNNIVEYLVKDRILIPHLSIYSDKKMNATDRNEGNRIDRGEGRMKSMLYLSRVGFNKGKTVALFYISHSGAPITSYFVYMVKKENKWLIRDVVMDEMFIY